MTILTSVRSIVARCLTVLSLAVALPVIGATTAAGGAVAFETVTFDGTPVLTVADFGPNATVSTPAAGQIVITGTVNDASAFDTIHFALPAGKTVTSGTMTVTNYVAAVPAVKPLPFPLGSNDLVYAAAQTLPTRTLSTTSVNTNVMANVAASTRCGAEAFSVQISTPSTTVADTQFMSFPPFFVPMPFPVNPTTTYGSASYVITLQIGDAATDSTLSGLTTPSGALSPAFAPGTANYAISVLNPTSVFQLTPTSTSPAAIITRQIGMGQAVELSNGSASSFSLPVGATTVTFDVCAQDGSHTAYTVTVFRLPPPPTISNVTPDTLLLGNTDRDLDLTGTNFLPGSQNVTFTPPGGSPVPGVIQTSTTTTATVTLPGSALGIAGTGTITLNNAAAEATIGIQIGSPILDDRAFAAGKKPFEIDVLANDGAGTGSIAIVTPPQHGTASVVDGKVRYVPNGPLPLEGDTFTYSYNGGTATVTVTNFAAIAGNYDGLIRAEELMPNTRTIGLTPQMAHDRAGYLRVRMTKTGAFTAVLTFAGTNLNPMARNRNGHGYNSALDSAGGASRIVVRGGAEPIGLSLRFDAKSHAFVGTLESTGSAGLEFSSPFQLDALTPDSERAGQYTMLVRSDSIFVTIPPEHGAQDLAGVPLGSGFATVTIRPTGDVKLAGKLADGAPFSSASYLHADKTFPLYSSVYRGPVAARGSVRGDIAFFPQPPPIDNQAPQFVRGFGDAQGFLEWFKPARPLDKFFPAGFGLNPTAIVARYTPPARGTAMLTFDGDPASGSLFVHEGGIAAFYAPFTLSAANRVTFEPPNTPVLTLRLNTRLGFFGGTFIHPTTGRTLRIGGAVLQGLGTGAGYFLGTGPTDGGAVDLDSARTAF